MQNIAVSSQHAIETLNDTLITPLATREGHFVVRGAAGGLEPGASLEHLTTIDAKDKTKAASAKITMIYRRDATGAKTWAEGAAPEGENAEK